MPSVTAKQARTMAAAAHAPAFAKRMGIPQNVAREFNRTDQKAGTLHKQLGVPDGDRVPASRLRAAAARKLKR